MARRKNKLVGDLKRLTSDYDGSGTKTLDNFEDAQSAFLRKCKLRNLSEHTVTYYKNELKWFRVILEKQGRSTRPSEITKKVIEDNVILYLMESEGCKIVTINTLLRAVKSFFKFLADESHIESNPVETVALLKEPKTIIETFTRDQIDALLRQPNQTTFTGVRDYVMMCLFLETGARLREVAELRLNDIRWDESQILLHGKNGKDRLVPIQRTMLRELKRWVTLRGKVSHDFLFINIDNGPISKRQIQSRITRYGRKANITNVRCSPHTLRHTFAKMSVLNGANVFDLQDILGHSSLEMVKVYVNLYSSDVFESHKRFSPLENLRRH